ncbi:MAG: DUF5615 family PIN-like protein [Acidobacteria bacterium]|nr:DUF5615 family PIN-like protein [Acidobacteriota bacterium]
MPVVVELRRLGHDVLTAFEDGRANRAIADELVLARSRNLNRVLLTINRTDFRLLHRSGQQHAGIVICTLDIDLPGQASRIDRACSEIDDASGQLIRVNRSA